MGVIMIEPTSNVVAFRKRAAPGPTRHPKSIIEAVYAAGSLPIPADDRSTKTAAVLLQALGFLVVDEILADGTPRPLKRGELRAAIDRPWRLSKPAFTGEAGLPDADGALRQS
jgi:hypothetical protein